MAADATVLETERLRLTGWRTDQLEDLVRLHGDPDIARYLSGDGHPWSEAECRDRLAVWMKDFANCGMGKLRLVRQADDVLVGRAGFGLYPLTGEAEIGYALFPQHQGHGYALEAAQGLADWLFRDTGRDHFIGFADRRNTPSLKILEAIGMAPTHVAVEPDGLECQFYRRDRPAE
jgi:ribosomal-protein-alanine N-acetyltransferase